MPTAHRMRLGLVLGLLLSGCTSPEVTACVARCQSATADPATCQTLCTRSCDELQRTFGVSEASCRQLQSGEFPATASERPPPHSSLLAGPHPLTGRCPAFVAFHDTCGITLTAPDPTLGEATRSNDPLVLRQAHVDRCLRGEPPFDEALFRCHEVAATDCARYRACADAVVESRQSP
jgi:hypothetical protein